MKEMKKKMIVLCIAVIVLLAANIFQFTWNKYANRLWKDAVPNEETALQIGSAVIEAMYGKDFSGQRTYGVKYDDKKKVWYVWVQIQEDIGPPAGILPEVTIRQHDGKIMNAK